MNISGNHVLFWSKDNLFSKRLAISDRVSWTRTDTLSRTAAPTVSAGSDTVARVWPSKKLIFLQSSSSILLCLFSGSAFSVLSHSCRTRKCVPEAIKICTYGWAGQGKGWNDHVYEQMLEQMDLGCFRTRYTYLVCNSRGQTGHYITPQTLSDNPGRNL